MVEAGRARVGVRLVVDDLVRRRRKLGLIRPGVARVLRLRVRVVESLQSAQLEPVRDERHLARGPDHVAAIVVREHGALGAVADSGCAADDAARACWHQRVAPRGIRVVVVDRVEEDRAPGEAIGGDQACDLVLDRRLLRGVALRFAAAHVLLADEPAAVVVEEVLPAPTGVAHCDEVADAVEEVAPRVGSLASIRGVVGVGVVARETAAHAVVREGADDVLGRQAGEPARGAACSLRRLGADEGEDGAVGPVVRP